MEALKRNYKCTLSNRQAMTHFDKEKPTYRGYTEHLNYLLQVNAAGGGHFDRNVLKSMVHTSGADLIHEISSKYDRNRTDYISHLKSLLSVFKKCMIYGVQNQSVCVITQTANVFETEGLFKTVS
jgi:hypothetical protein